MERRVSRAKYSLQRDHFPLLVSESVSMCIPSCPLQSPFVPSVGRDLRSCRVHFQEHQVVGLLMLGTAPPSSKRARKIKKSSKPQKLGMIEIKNKKELNKTKTGQSTRKIIQRDPPSSLHGTPSPRTQPRPTTWEMTDHCSN